jgi:FMN phosphatase YigB (HAD superfamily)
MKKERLILTDCDGTILDWNSPFEAFMSESGYLKKPNTDHDYSIAVRYNISKETAKECIVEFNKSPQIKTLQPFADSEEYIKKLSDNGFKFIAITSVGQCTQIYQNREHNLKNLFGDVFNEIHCLDMNACKFDTLTKWSNKEYFWIEDHKTNAESGKLAGLKSILINHPYNLEYTSNLFTSVSDTTPWKEIYDIVCEEYNLKS